MPSPSSRDGRCRSDCRGARGRTQMWPCSGVNLIAFDSRFQSTCCRRVESPSTIGVLRSDVERHLDALGFGRGTVRSHGLREQSRRRRAGACRAVTRPETMRLMSSRSAIKLRQRRAVVDDQRESLAQVVVRRRRTCGPGSGSRARSRTAACAIRATAWRGIRPWHGSRSRPPCAPRARFRAALRARARRRDALGDVLAGADKRQQLAAAGRCVARRWDSIQRHVAVGTAHARRRLERLPCLRSAVEERACVGARVVRMHERSASHRGAPPPG